MITRTLDPSEWPRLAGTDLAPVLATFPQDAAQPIVVEHDGEVVGCWALLTLCHAEGVWIAPEHRKGAAVARRLTMGMREAAQAKGVGGVLTGAADEHVAGLLTKLGAVKVPYGNYYWPMR